MKFTMLIKASLNSMTHLHHSCELRHHNRCTLGKPTVTVQNFVMTKTSNKGIDQRTFGTYLQSFGVFNTGLIFVVAGASKLIIESDNYLPATVL